jgi:hypothetical protein
MGYLFYLSHTGLLSLCLLPSSCWLCQSFLDSWGPSQQRSISTSAVSLCFLKSTWKCDIMYILFFSLWWRKKELLFSFCWLFEWHCRKSCRKYFPVDFFSSVAIWFCVQTRKLRREMLPILRKLGEDMLSESPRVVVIRESLAGSHSFQVQNQHDEGFMYYCVSTLNSYLKVLT